MNLLVILIALAAFMFSSLKINVENFTGGSSRRLTPIPTAIRIATPTPFTAKNGGYLSRIPNLYNDNLEFKTRDKLYLSEVNWFSFVIDKLIEKKWSGKPNQKLPITTSDIPPTLFSMLENRQQEISEDPYLIPSHLRSIFVDAKAQVEIYRLMLSSREEYLEYLGLRQVPDIYINEIINRTLPANEDRIRYIAKDMVTPRTGSQHLVSDKNTPIDFRKFQIEVYSWSVFNEAKSIALSGILGKMPPKENETEYREYFIHARELAVRYLMYHEMTHILQRAVDTVTDRPTNDYPKAAWSGNKKSLWNASSNYYRDWGSSDWTYTESANHVTSQESQAEGVAYEVFCFGYNLSPIQKRLFWEFRYEWMSEARNQMERSLSLFETHFPKISFADIGNLIYDDIVKQYVAGSREGSLLHVATRDIDSFPSAIGYFNPLKPEDSMQFWEFLKNGE